MKVPIDTTVEQMQELGKAFIDEASDNDILEALYDHPLEPYSPTQFDVDSFQVECIESENYDLLYSTPLWREYAGTSL